MQHKDIFRQLRPHRDAEFQKRPLDVVFAHKSATYLMRQRVARRLVRQRLPAGFYRVITKLSFPGSLLCTEARNLVHPFVCMVGHNCGKTDRACADQESGSWLWVGLWAARGCFLWEVVSMHTCCLGSSGLLSLGSSVNAHLLSLTNLEATSFLLVNATW